MKLDSKLSPLVRDFDDVWPLEVMHRLALPKYLDPRVTVGNQVHVTLVVLGDRKRRVNKPVGYDLFAIFITLRNGTLQSRHQRDRRKCPY